MLSSDSAKTVSATSASKRALQLKYRAGHILDFSFMREYNAGYFGRSSNISFVILENCDGWLADSISAAYAVQHRRTNDEVMLTAVRRILLSVSE
ncbi:hypothetical protein K3495_g7122 [Podosphaera aphanis]|nr:hypothetical protein K3495_g7122 [Podosphaera aphanis]